MSNNIPIKTRAYVPADRNYITNSYMTRLERQLGELPQSEKWKLSKAHDELVKNLPQALVICLIDDDNHIVAYKVGTFTHIKKAYINWRNEIEEMLKK